MNHLPDHALQATHALRGSPGYAAMTAAERADLDYHLGRVESALMGNNPSVPGYDPYSVPMATPNDLLGGGNQQGQPTQQQNVFGASPSQPPSSAQNPSSQRAIGTEVLGERARRSLEAVDFPSFVAELIQGTFIAIVDATSQQVQEYAKLVADLSQTVEQFTQGNVSVNQARDRLVERHRQDLRLILPGPGDTSEPRVEPFEGLENESPAWLNEYGLSGATLTPELAEGPLLQASRRMLGEDRMRNLATMVLMGINRIVVDDGQLKARLQFHAHAREKVNAEVVGQGAMQQTGIAGRQNSMRSAVSTMVSTVDVNSQADVAIKADLVGEVSLKFRTETFDLNNFADSSVVQMISRHSLTKASATTPPQGAATHPTPPTNEG